MSPQFKVVRADREHELTGVDAQLRAWGVQLLRLPDGASEQALAREVADADLLLVCHARVTERVVANATRLRAIVKCGVGIDAIDMDAACVRQIPVVNVPDYAEETVAEGAFALMMALFKRIKPVQLAMQTKGWVWPEPRWLAHDLAGKTLGLVGLGRIGRRVARMASAFRMTVLANNPGLSQADAPDTVTMCENLDSMIERCDALSIHCVLNRETRHLIGAEQLARMKPTAFLVNVSRGEVVDEAALVKALVQRRIAGAALDVYGREPLAREGHLMSVLFEMDHVILWPHLTFYTHEAMQRLEREVLARCREALSGEPLSLTSLDRRLRRQTHGVRLLDRQD